MERKGWLVAAAVACGTLAGTVASAQDVTIEVLSSRADLVTGGDALVRVTGSAAPTVTVNGADVSAAFAEGPGGGWIGLVDGLADGDNTLVATAGGAEANVTLVNHPINGTLFAGPQQMPFLCENEIHGLAPAEDESCTAPTVVQYFYRNNDGAWQPFDPEGARPNDIGMTTTTEGNEVPMIVRIEKGVINRAAYALGLLHDPAAGPPPSPTARTPGWNGKLVYAYAGGLLAGYHMGNVIGQLDANNAYVGGTQNQFHDALIEGGYALAAGSLNAFRITTNDVVSAETTAKIKERFIEAYGAPIFTIGTGGSGGSMQQHLIANNYPGILDGIFPRISYPDAVTFFWPLYDCDLLINYFDNTELEWTPLQKDIVSGKVSYHYCPTNGPRYTDQNLRAAVACDPVVEESIMFGDIERPRCTYQDNLVNIFGVDPDTGFARNPWDNTGVQYGLNALNDGIITVAQFIDLNRSIGGHDVDGNIVAERTEGDPIALEIVYRTGRVNMGGAGLNEVPIIDYRGYTDGICTVAPCPPREATNVDIHDGYHSETMRLRLIEANGDANNQVILIAAETGDRGRSSPLSVMTITALEQMDRWLTAIVNDTSDLPKAEKVRIHRPADLVDGCYSSSQAFTSNWEVCERLFPMATNARIVAGATRTDEIFKCQLRPVSRDDYTVELSDEELAAISAIFAGGVCDYSLPGVGQVPLAGTWLKYTGESGYQSLALN